MEESDSAVHWKYWCDDECLFNLYGGHVSTRYGRGNEMSSEYVLCCWIPGGGSMSRLKIVK